MRFIIFIKFLTILMLTSCETQHYEEPKIKTSKTFNHIKHIREESKRQGIGSGNEEFNYLVDDVIKNLLEKPEHRKYITDRRLLKKLENKTCWDDYVLISDTLLNGNECKIEIRTQTFLPENHKLKYQENSGFLVGVDGKYPFGAVYLKHPIRELVSLEIKINGGRLDTKLEEYQNIYEPEFCNFGSYRRITEAYEDGDNIYIYIFGGENADSYFAKLIFDETGYVTSIIADYGTLSDYGSFGEHFIGF